jgi:Flp pilus assembly protein TadD
VAGRALWFYAGKLAWPRDLTFIYPRWTVDAGALWQYAFPVTALAAILILWAARSRLGRGPLVAVLCFAGTLVPALGFFDVYPMRFSFVADHFQYLASAALLVLAGAVAAHMFQRICSPGAWTGPALGGAVLLILGLLSWRQQAAYVSLGTLWRDTLKKNPGCWLAHYNLGRLLLDQREPDGAVEHLAAALENNPRLLEAHANWCLVLLQQGKFHEAEEHLEAALRLSPRDPVVASMYRNLGVARAQHAEWAEAIRCFSKALEIDPHYAAARCNLGAALAEQERWTEAVRELAKVITDNPDSAEAYDELGQVLVRQGKADQAIFHHHRAVSLRPDVAGYRVNLGEALRQCGRLQEAEFHLHEASRLQGNRSPGAGRPWKIGRNGP